MNKFETDANRKKDAIAGSNPYKNMEEIALLISSDKNKDMESLSDKKIPCQEEEIMELAIGMGCLLLQSGAEIFRVEDTISRLYKHYGLETGRCFVLTNGIFVTSGGSREDTFARVENIEYYSTDMKKIVEINELSREIEQGKLSPAQALASLEKIKKVDQKPFLPIVMATGIASAAFCYLLDTSLRDILCSFMSGCLLSALIIFAENTHMSKFVRNFLGAAFVTIISCAFYVAEFAVNLNPVIIGSIMPLIPGVAFTNSIRDIVEGNYLSGIVRMLDALIVFSAIAIGAAMGLTIVHRINGGVLL